MKPGDREYETLSKALLDTPPNCEGDVRYTLDTARDVDKEEMVAKCFTCPLLDLCAQYAAAAKPPAGFWPGVRLNIGKAA